MSQNSTLKRGLPIAAIVVILGFIGVYKGIDPSQESGAQFSNTFRWVPDEIRAYKLEQNVVIDLSSPLGTPEETGIKSLPKQEMALNGTLLLRIDEVNEDSIIGRIGFSSLTVKTGNQRDSILEKLYGSPAKIAFQKNGVVKEVSLPNSIAKEDEYRLSGLLKSLQVSLRNNSSSVWQAKERDSLGTSVVEYRRNEDQAGRFKRERVEYLKADTTQRYFDSVKVESSTGEFAPSAAGSWFSHFKNIETLGLYDGIDKKLRSEVSIDIREIKTPSYKSLPEWSKGSQQQFTSLLTSGVKVARSPIEIEEDKLERAQFTKSNATVGRLAKRLTGTMPPAEILDRASKLTRYLTLFPEQIPALVKTLKEEPYTEDAGAHLVYALQRVKTDESELALTDIAGDAGHSQANQRRALIALGQLPINTHTETFLWDLATQRGEPHEDRLARMSLYAIGASAGHLTEAGEEVRATAIVERLGEMLTTASEQNQYQETARYLRALGNTFRGDAGQQIIPHLALSDSPEVREAAASGLESIKTPEANNILVEQLMEEDSPRVRKAIVQSLANREPSIESVVSILQVTMEEENAATRRVMALYLKNAAKHSDEIREGIHEGVEQLLVLETDPENYKLLVAALR